MDLSTTPHPATNPPAHPPCFNHTLSHSGAQVHVMLLYRLVDPVRVAYEAYDLPHAIHYALKANSSLALLRLLRFNKVQCGAL